jgi:hypothetical protein
VILVVLALVWAVALTPTVLRKLAERRSSYSVDRFHDSLHAIQFAGPNIWAASRPSMRGVRVTSGGNRRAMGFWPGVAPSVPEYSPAVETSNAPVGPLAKREGPTRVNGQTARRRRQVLGSIAGVLLGSLLIGFIPGARFFWDVAIVALVAGAAYIGLLIYFRRVAIEQSRKVVFIGSIRPTGVHSLVRPPQERPRPAALVVGG